jgi:signal recognition particle receptor subunit beta
VIEGLGAEGEETELGGLDCGGPGKPFKFAEWDGGEVAFIGTSTTAQESEKASLEHNCTVLEEWLQENF